jgi:hypothetical protein
MDDMIRQILFYFEGAVLRRWLTYSVGAGSAPAPMNASIHLATALLHNF